MSFILVPTSVGPLNIITLTGATLTNFVPGTTYTFTLTALDQFTTYNVSTDNGTASLNTSTGVVTWTPATSTTTGAIANLTIGKRTLQLQLVPVFSVDYFVISGGSGGSAWNGNGGGGGAGFYITGAANLTKTLTYTATVGGGGVGGVNSANSVGNGGTSSFAGNSMTGGIRPTPSDSTFNGGGTSPSGFPASTGSASGNGGGAGAGAAGQNGTGTKAGDGGAGLSLNFYGQTVQFGGGGGGGASNYDRGLGGLYGGGDGAQSSFGVPPTSATVNTGGGGGGSRGFGVDGGAGGSGRCIVRYLTSYGTPTLTGTYTTTTSGLYTFINWTSSGTIVFP